MPLLLGEAAAQRERIQTSVAGSAVSGSAARSQSSAGYSSNPGATGGAGSGVPPSVYIRANQETAKGGSDGSNQAPAPNSNEALIQQSHAELLRQLLQPQPPMAAASLPPAVANPSQSLQAAFASFLNPNLQVQQQPPQPQPQQQQQQPNQALMALDILQLLGLNQLQTPLPTSSGGVASAVSQPSDSWATKPASKPHFAVPEQGKRVPGSTRVPCRARGMPPDHCSESAYFWIHPDMSHGADLLCCYPSCREGGVKFRYCKVCKVPAAKRSFLFRHGHSNKKRPGRESPPISSSDAEEVSDSGASDGEKKVKRNLTFHEDTKAGSESETSEKKIKDAGEPVKKPSSPSLVSRESGTESGKAAKKRRLDTAIDTQSSQSSVSSTTEDTRIALWRDLLYQRPIDDDEDKMSLWLMRIVQASSTKGIRPATTTTSPLSEPSSCGSNSAQ